jgi:uncharacterized membrane protein YhaH (DUF805 family)
MRILKIFFSFQGRIGRLEFFLVTLLLSLINSALALLEPEKRVAMIIVYAIVSAILLISSMALSVRRLHDLNRSGWWTLLPFAVLGFVGFYMVVEATGLENQDMNGFANLIEKDAVLFIGAIVFSLAFGAWIAFTRGSVGSNGFGPEPSLFGIELQDEEGAPKVSPVVTATPAQVVVKPAPRPAAPAKPAGFGRRGTA